MTQLTEIYKRTSGGKIQTWTMEIDGGKYRTVSGLQDGRKVTSAWTTCEGKNLGKTNATTPEDQAFRECMAKRKKKLEKEYKEDINEVDNIDYPEPMSAHGYKGIWEGPVYAQPKYDGVRCKATAAGLFSRYGKEFLACPHISEMLAPLFAHDPDLVLDGELYNHDLKDDFDELISCIKQQKPTQEDLSKARNVVQYHMYDIMDTKTIFSERIEALQAVISTEKSSGILHVAPTYFVQTKDELDEFYDKFLEEGYEGQMIRKNVPYVHKRTNSLLKRKEFIDDEFEIVDVTEGKGNRAGMAGKVWIKLHKPTTEGVTTCEANPKGGNAFYKRLLAEKDQVIGKMCTIRFQNYTPKGSLRFPRMIIVRDYE